MADKLKKEPEKGILKHQSKKKEKTFQWDEMNILATHHPPDKDYGFMKIDEPNTPYNYIPDTDEDNVDGCVRRNSVEMLNKLDPSALMQKLADGSGPKVLTETEPEENLSPEEKAKRQAFEKKRKMHYNEFLAVQKMRNKIEDDDDE